MRSLLGACLWLLAVSLSAESLSLTIHYDNGDPGEEHEVWTARYYTDAEGRLTRSQRTTGGRYEGDPEVTEETRYTWSEGGVQWGHEEAIVFEDSGLRRESGQFPSRTWTLVSVSAWVNGGYRSEWASTSGFSVEPLESNPSKRYAIRTSGSRLSRLVDQEETDFVLLDRTKNKLTATFYGNFLEENGWVPTGTVVLSGSGLYTSNAKARLAHAAVLSEHLWFPVWVPFVFEKNYLR